MKIVTYLVGCAITICAFQLSKARIIDAAALAECKGHSVVFLDSANCERILTASDVLVGVDPDDFDVTIAGTTTNVLDCSHAGKRVLVSLTPSAGGTSFFCSVMVEDRTAPTLMCPDTFLRCDVNLDLWSRDSFGVEVFEACKLDTVFPILCGVIPGSCAEDDDTLKTLKVLWQALDSSGNMSSCTQMIKLQRPNLQDIVPPKDDTLYCEDFDLSTAEQPTLFEDTPIDGKCGLVLSYLTTDTMELLCGEKWITREWSVLELCTLESLEGIQMIAVLDTLAPLVDCPEDKNLTLPPTPNGQFEYTLPEPQITPHCNGDDIGVVVSYKIGTAIYQPNQVALLELGSNLITCTAVDQCWKTSTDEFEVVVAADPNSANTIFDNVVKPAWQDQEKSVVFPSPAESNVDLHVSSLVEIGSDITVNILDINGNVLLSRNEKLPANRNLHFDKLGDLPQGMINIIVITPNSFETLKLVKI